MQIFDDLKRSVVIRGEIKKIISLCPSITETPSWRASPDECHKYQYVFNGTDKHTTSNNEYLSV